MNWRKTAIQTPEDCLFSIIIPNYNGEDVINSCLQSVVSKTKHLNCEIIVVDNGSSDKSVKMINEMSCKDPRLKLLRLDRNVGFSGACYMGLKSSRGNFIALLSNDTKVTEGWLQGLMKKLLSSDRKVGAAQSKLLLMDHPTRIDSVGHVVDRLLFLRPEGYLEKDLGQYDRMSNVPVLQVVSCLIRRDVINEVGGLFEPVYFMIHEDTDLSLRLHLRGYTIALASDSVVYHKRSWTLRKFSPELITYLSRRNALMTIVRNYEIVNMLFYGYLSILFYVLMVLWHLAAHRGGCALAIIRALSWNFKNLRKIMIRRYFIQQNVRNTSDNEVFKLFDPISLSRLVRFRNYGPLLTIHLKMNDRL